MRLDAHQHFWKYDAASYAWIKPDWPIRRDFLPGELKQLLEQNRFEGSIAVQARQSLQETRWLLELAERHEFIKGVVGWVNLCSEGVESELESFAKNPKFVGVRHVVQDEPDDDFMRRADFLRGISKLERFDLAYDLLIFPRQITAAIEVVRGFPEQRFVLDHLAKPLIKDGVLSPWREQIDELGKFRNVACKLSGMVTEANWNKWTNPDFKPYLDVVFSVFGCERLMFGSDWPVCLLSGNYEKVFSLVNERLAPLRESEREAVLGGNAWRFYARRERSRE